MKINRQILEQVFTEGLNTAIEHIELTENDKEYSLEFDIEKMHKARKEYLDKLLHDLEQF